jgi:hypothetical protein
MKKFYFIVLGVIVTFASCVSLQDRQMTANERASTQVIGSVTVKFTSFQFFHIPNKKSLGNKAYTELMKAAQRDYVGNIDIKNITISGGGSGWEAVYVVGSILLGIPFSFSFDEKDGDYYLGGDNTFILGIVAAGINFIGNFQKITAKGDVVMATASQTQRRTTNSTATGIEGALERAAEQTLRNIPARSKIAIVYITAQDRSTTEFIAGELEYIWVNAGYTIIDRSQLDRIRREQNFQMSGEVDDDTAVSIGKFIGANIIVTGRVDGEGNLRRLRLRALDTQTAQVVGVASERL